MRINVRANEKLTKRLQEASSHPKGKWIDVSKLMGSKGFPLHLKTKIHQLRP
jgi:hypothetical protein